MIKQVVPIMPSSVISVNRFRYVKKYTIYPLSLS